MNNNTRSRLLNRSKDFNSPFDHKAAQTPAGCIVSCSPKKNIQMVIRHNVDAGGNKQSITRFEPMDASRPAYRFKGAKAKAS